MSSARPPITILNKRLFEGTLFYEVQKAEGPSSEWVRFEDLRTHHIDNVLAFETALKEKRVPKQTPILPAPRLQKEEPVQRDIKELLFVGKEGATLHFELVYSDGSSEAITNSALRKKDPELLIDIYERHVVIE